MGCWVNTIERIMRRFVEKTDACWIWKGYCKNGYGHARFDGKLHEAHRLIYESLRGPIPDGLVLDHLCRNPACVNPDHLEPVTQKENIQRGLKGILRTHCKNGHPANAENLVIISGVRRCKICKSEAHKRWAVKNKQYLQQYMHRWKKSRKALA